MPLNNLVFILKYSNRNNEAFIILSPSLLLSPADLLLTRFPNGVLGSIKPMQILFLQMLLLPTAVLLSAVWQCSIACPFLMASQLHTNTAMGSIRVNSLLNASLCRIESSKRGSFIGSLRFFLTDSVRKNRFFLTDFFNRFFLPKPLTQTCRATLLESSKDAVA